VSTGDTHNYSDSVSRDRFLELFSIRGEGDEWDFKRTLGTVSDTEVRVNLGKDALAMCNLPSGGTLVIGVADDYERVGLGSDERIDTTIIRKAVEKFIDGDFAIAAAEHEVQSEGDTQPKRYGVVHFQRRSAQPVIAAMNGDVPGRRTPLFRGGDILIRRGAQSIRANSGDVRRLLTSSVVNTEKVKAVNELWSCMVEQRRLLGGLEYLYDILVEPEYSDVPSRPQLLASLGQLTETQHASRVDELATRVSLVRPYLTDALYQQYRAFVAFVGRLHMKAIRQRDRGEFRAWTQLDDGSPDDALMQLATQLVSDEEVQQLWAGRHTNLGTLRALRPAIDATEQVVLDAIKKVLAGLS
jgi:hypothetical protein